MLVFGTNYDYFNAVWVKNEWSRFLKLIEQDSSRTLIPCYKDIDAYDMPREFAKLQAQDMGKVGAIQDLVRGIGKIIVKKEEPVPVVQVNKNAIDTFTEPLLERANDFLAKGDFAKAKEFFEKVIDFEPNNEKALFGLFLLKFKVRNIEELGSTDVFFDDSVSYSIMLNSCDTKTRDMLQKATEKIKNNILTKAEKCLQYKQWDEARKYYKRLEHRDNQSYLWSMLLCEFKVSDKNQLASLSCEITSSEYYKKLYKTCNADDKTFLNECNEKIKRTIAKSNRKRKQLFILAACILAVIIISIPVGIKIYHSSDAYIFDVERTTDGYIIRDLNDVTILDNGHLEIPSTINGKPVVSISGRAFADNTDIVSVSIPNSITHINSGAFDGCTSLTSITIPSSVTEVDVATFSNCTNLTSVTIPSGVTSIGNFAFFGCTNLTSIEIPSSVTSAGNYAFYGCTSLTSVTIQEGVKRIGGGAFSGCTSLISITIPSSVTSIASHAYDGFTILTSIEIPSSVTSIGDYAFYGCTSLTSVAIQKGVISIDESAFEGCTSLTSIVIPSSITRIGYSAFSYCTSLTSIEIPSSVTIINWRAFYGCINLTIYCEAGSKPNGWDDDWNSTNCPVVWGHKQ